MKGILGTKIGMTQVFTQNGKLIPVTVVEVEPNVVTQIKTTEKDGYDAIQLGYKTVSAKHSNKPKMGHTKKAGCEPKRFLREIRGVNVNDYTLGQTLDASVLTEGEMVDVSGVSKGKGFQGVIKRYNQSRGPMGHGSQYHRGVGSLGTLRPMHVLKGKKLPGHMGHVMTTVQNLVIVQVDTENNCLLIKGNVPGPKNSLVLIRTAVKNKDTVQKMEELITYQEIENQEAVETVEVTTEANEEAVETPVEEAPAQEETTQEAAPIESTQDTNETTDESSQEEKQEA